MNIAFGVCQWAKVPKQGHAILHSFVQSGYSLALCSGTVFGFLAQGVEFKAACKCLGFVG